MAGVRTARQSGVESGGEEELLQFPGADVMIHRKDFLIHIKKVSCARSQSSDCASEGRASPAAPRRASSAQARAGTGPRPSPHPALARTKAASLKYSGSQSTSSIPRKLEPELQHQFERKTAGRKTSDDSVTDSELGGPVSSRLSFLAGGGQGAGQARDRAGHGRESPAPRKKVQPQIERTESPVPRKKGLEERTESPVPRKKEQIQEEKTESMAPRKKVSSEARPSSRQEKRVGKHTEETLKNQKSAVKEPQTKEAKKRQEQRKVAASSKLGTKTPVSVSVSAPRTKKALAVSVTAPVCGPGRGKAAVRAVRSATGPVLPARAASPAPGPIQHKKKVSSEYCSEAGLRNQEGLAWASVAGPARRPSTLRQRLLGTDSPARPAPPPAPPTDLAAHWLQLKTDIEAAMARKPRAGRTGPGQYKALPDLTMQVINIDQESVNLTSH